MDDVTTDVSVLRNKTKAAEDFVIICVERPEDGAVVQPGATIFGRGWVLSNADIEYIPDEYFGIQFVGYASYGEFRPDVAERFPTYAQADQSGFSFSIKTPPHPAEQPEDVTVVVRTVYGRDTRRVVSLAKAPDGNPAAGQATGVNSSTLRPVRLFVEDARIDDAGLSARARLGAVPRAVAGAPHFPGDAGARRAGARIAPLRRVFGASGLSQRDELRLPTRTAGGWRRTDQTRLSVSRRFAREG